MAPPPYDKSLLMPDTLLDGAQRERLSSSWAESVINSVPPRLSLRDPLQPANEALARR